MYQFQTILLVQQSRDEKNFKNIKIFFQDFLLILKLEFLGRCLDFDENTLKKLKISFKLSRKLKKYSLIPDCKEHRKKLILRLQKKRRLSYFTIEITEVLKIFNKNYNRELPFTELKEQLVEGTQFYSSFDLYKENHLVVQIGQSVSRFQQFQQQFDQEICKHIDRVSTIEIEKKSCLNQQINQVVKEFQFLN